MEENSLLQELVSVVKSLEAAQLEPRALSEAESQALDRTRDPRTPVVAWAGKNATAGERLQLRSLAHRIWAALGHSSTEPLQGAKCRSLACELLEEGLEESAASAGSSDAALLASHWALTGRAWALAKEDAVALQCFGRASKSAAGTKNAEADVQARLWAAEVLFRRGDYAESLEELAQAKGQLRQLPPQMLDNLLCVCYTQASSHRSAQNFPQAVELLNLALSAGNMPAATKCKLLRLLALCHVPELDVALAHARQALALAGCSKDRVAAQEVLLELLQSRECRSLRATAPVADRRPSDATDDVFASNPRVQEQQRRQWQEEKGFGSLFDPSIDAERLQSQMRAEELERLSPRWEEPQQPLLRQVPSHEVAKDDFHRYRWRCIFQPERAAETLGPVAELQLCAVRARDLGCRELSATFQPLCNPSVKVFLDDNLVSRSKCQQGTITPEWHFEKTLDVTCPFSMLRVQVSDQGKSNLTSRDSLGFVEISLGDLPFGNIEGWFELRHQDALRRDSLSRYATHCRRRDDAVARPGRLRRSNQDQEDEDKRSFLTSCATYFADRSKELLPAQAQKVIRAHQRANAGEIFLRLHLSYLDRGKDSFFALALNPRCHDYGTHLQAEESEFQLQDAWDDMMDVKYDVVEDAIHSSMNFVSYICQWRCILLTAIILASLICPLGYSAIHPDPRNLWLIPAVIPGLFALLLFLLCMPRVRNFMLHGGGNAPLTQEGFARVAAWRDTDQMVMFVSRMVSDLKGSVSEPQELRSFASRCFREGRPSLTLAELRTGLKAAQWVNLAVDVPAKTAEQRLSETDHDVLLREGFPSTRLRPGDLVRVDLRARAVAKRIEDPYVVVEYEEPELAPLQAQETTGSPSPTGDYESLEPEEVSPKARSSRSRRPSTEEKVPKARLSLRPAVPVPKQCIPHHLAGEIHGMCIVLDDCKRHLCPTLRAWGDVLCWRRWGLSLLLLAFLVSVSAVSAMAFAAESTDAWSVAASALRYIVLVAKILLIVVLLISLTHKAKWLVPIRSLGRIFWRSFRWRRAPQMWPFYREAVGRGAENRETGVPLCSLAMCKKHAEAAPQAFGAKTAVCESNAQKEEVRSLALSLVREPESSVALCVATCQVLLDYGMHQDAQQLSASLRSRPGLGEEQRRELLLQTLQMAAEAVIQSKAEAEQHLVGAVANVETCAELCLPGGRLLSGLASKLWSGRPDDAANWASRAAQMMSKSNEAGDEAADCWFDAGRRFRQLGKLPEAQRCAREAKGHVEAQLLLLELACEAGKDCAEGWTCMEQLRQMDLTLAQASRAAQAARQQPHEDLALAALELFVAASESQADLTSLAVAAHLVKRHTELQRPTEELLQTLAAARRLGAQCRRGLAAELSSAGLAEPEPRPGLAALRQLVACAWGRGEELGRNLQWQQAAAMFEAGHQVLEVIDMDSQGLDPARLREFVDARAWCMIQDAAARVEQAKDRAGGQLKEALELLEKAHRLCKQSRQLQSQGAFAEAPCSSSTWCHRRFLTLVLQEFEVRCLIGEPEQQLRRFVDTASAESELGVKSLLAMSKLAASASCRRLAIHCLQRYLKTFIGASDADFKELLAAYREMLALQASRNESLVVFDGILNLLAGVNVSSDAKFPKEEIKWLVATAWNTGTHFFRLQQYRWAEKWMSKGMALAKLCPGSFSSEKMTEGYIACLNHCA
ncbi:unnamed protein product [Effrenium voratum]|nr:unnamed protein product [Effrenium voratum]